MRDRPRQPTTYFLPVEGAGADVVWQPRADIYHIRNGWLVKLELAGVRPEDITIWARGSRLTISGIRRDRIIEEGWSCYAMEIAYSHFERSMDLPFAVEKARIAVESRDGMLLVRVAAEGSHL